MELIVAVVLVIGVAWFAVPRLTSRRQADETLAETELRGGGMLSWLPAWMLISTMTHGDSGGSDASAHGGDAGWGGDVGGGGDSGGGGGGGFGGD